MLGGPCRGRGDFVQVSAGEAQMLAQPSAGDLSGRGFVSKPRTWHCQRDTGLLGGKQDLLAHHPTGRAHITRRVPSVSEPAGRRRVRLAGGRLPSWGIEEIVTGAQPRWRFGRDTRTPAGVAY